jgi:drug/metabolite transporter (DMT)-like permease
MREQPAATPAPEGSDGGSDGSADGGDAGAGAGPRHHRRSTVGALYALAAALLWGGSVPLSKQVADRGYAPLECAALLYGGAAIGLSAWLGLRRRSAAPAPPRATVRDWRWLGATTVVGAIAAPVFLVYGQARTTGLAAALLLAIEPPATALIAFGFGERLSRRVLLGAAIVSVGAVLVALGPGGAQATTILGALAVAAAACGWALDNNLTTKVSHLDAAWVAMMKGGLGAALGLGLSAVVSGRPIWAGHWASGDALQLLAAGFGGYGLGLSFIVRAFRELGAARTAAIFASAPLFGAVLTVPILGERPSPTLGVAAVILAVGVALIVTERHEPAR